MHRQFVLASCEGRYLIIPSEYYIFFVLLREIEKLKFMHIGCRAC